MSAERKHVRQKAMAIFEVLEAKKLVSNEIRLVANIDGGHRKTDDIHISVDAPDMSDQEKERNEETSHDNGSDGNKDLPALQVIENFKKLFLGFGSILNLKVGITKNHQSCRKGYSGSLHIGLIQVPWVVLNDKTSDLLSDITDMIDRP